MIITRIIGGLGNQLFQYAAARRLSLLHQTTLKLDTTGFEHYDWHDYSLGPFCIQEEFATQRDIAKIHETSENRSIFTESTLNPYDPNILKTPKNVYLGGYWQSEKYFIDIQDVIRREFTIHYEQDHQSQMIAEIIVRTQSVSLHVRRGNYVSNPGVNRVHGTCSLEYYRQCIAKITETVMRPHFFIFSDDPPWVRQNLRLEYPTTYVSHNDATKDYEDLRLMSLCKHHIIANSSFSWWGAWLNPKPDKIVLAPSKWFNEPYNTQDLLPETWLRI